ncbi:subclass B3 metallo-beta-lactamase [Bradyrhizobium sp. U87765 SZCCT0131]|uniref:subclass B3 metallo-beta-lactamase n=1 Tax=unclassified Bradyrhizobium TaxID=2631580 RepID=UPI001BA5B999|nr:MULTISPECIES: subclass B3 metallo-beta-lactamase [unclassified Bradyrhizobium]MBR1217614.1 subclass B3 metallo-beta-lactamase [Bradyrhizobium sp. U87765 SZCCT0131]MBR1261440.1 subclass B3 metallo-beta-lactamase [Bradyrhizobium sp. U87765 SZCCT0134]MBR1303112.1 subclass B3 metallo-beta-lactamase [Bradyrhizobium sp. U87765 SZCCT0110]MBR1318718.1 subclass B3 metallo-beta-lactamase [Bradyrhizobium sp. U87765 SZCCT0109]MBR1347043.1 subclass B3 metallo-beta-lactamase [Bradyrhizobium sp. U87765 SZ
MSSLPARAAVAALLIAASPCAQAEPFAAPQAWFAPVAPFRIIGGVYYVGTQGLGAYLITSGRQAILLDGTMPENAQRIEASIKALGYRMDEIKIILNNHAHLDHAGAIAQLKRDSGAAVYASAEDRSALEHGHHEGDSEYEHLTFPPVAVDRVITDGETISLGDIRLTATLTPGHTRGCTSFAMPVTDGGRTLQVVFPCSISVAGNVLVGNKSYPGIVADFDKSFARLGAMKADVVLTGHPEVVDVFGRAAKLKAGDKDAFVDPALLGRLVSKAKADFETTLKKEQAGKKG